MLQDSELVFARLRGDERQSSTSIHLVEQSNTLVDNKVATTTTAARSLYGLKRRKVERSMAKLNYNYFFFRIFLLILKRHASFMQENRPNTINLSKTWPLIFGKRS